MSNKAIVMHFFEKGTPYLIPTTAHDIKFTERWGWLEKLCFKLLKKTGCAHIHFDEKQMVTSVYIDPDKAVSEIVLMAAHQLRMMDYRATKILMGLKEFDKLRTDPRLLPYSYQPFNFDVQLTRTETSTDACTVQYRTGLKLLNLNVEVIPWMDGVLVL